MNSPAAVLSTVSTEAVAPADRLAFWEHYNAEATVGLTCSTYVEEGLVARQLNLGLQGFRVSDIAANAHVVERAPKLVRSSPKDAVFVSVSIEGDAFFYHSQGCTPLVPGDVIVYPTDRPYLFGFTGRMRQLLIDVPIDLFSERCATPPVHPMKVDRHGYGARATSARALTSVLTTLVDDPSAAPLDTGDRILDLVTAMTSGGPGLTSMPRVLAAKEFIERRLDDPSLCTDAVASTLGVTPRHLNRAFAAEGISVAQYIQSRRLEAALRDLRGLRTDDQRIADVAARWGFSSQAHFTRLFRARFGCTPGAVRDGAVPISAEE
jgi:AraC-like DNA-binding protein